MRPRSRPIRCIPLSTIRIRPPPYASRASPRYRRRPRHEGVTMSTRFSTLSPALRALAEQHCHPGAVRLADADLAARLPTLAGWSADGGRLAKTFAFTNFHETIGFVDALAWIANR